jgi:hypothetical protein
METRLVKNRVPGIDALDGLCCHTSTLSWLNRLHDRCWPCCTRRQIPDLLLQRLDLLLQLLDG